MRGNRISISAIDTDTGSIPARAGEPLAATRRAGCLWVYPRACGGTGGYKRRSRRVRGLSPRVRGNPSATRQWMTGLRSIPARAGEPDEDGTRSFVSRVYPRACGGTCAYRARFARPWVYPRACGGTSGLSLLALARPGLSPRVRGNLVHQHPLRLGIGSIPARAGEPSAAAASCASLRVYPRACGGTPATAPTTTSLKGLSPRVRGNQSHLLVHPKQGGSIPARAGEPFFPS